jgi:hypothetical protein
VQLHSLSKGGLNGAYGVVVEWVAEKGRFNVRMLERDGRQANLLDVVDDFGEPLVVLGVRPANLRVIGDQEDLRRHLAGLEGDETEGDATRGVNSGGGGGGDGCGGGGGDRTDDARQRGADARRAARAAERTSIAEKEKQADGPGPVTAGRLARR